ncbi:hypothetical protein ACFXJM_12530 [Streptomyces massasporeus]
MRSATSADDVELDLTTVPAARLADADGAHAVLPQRARWSIEPV